MSSSRQPILNIHKRGGFANQMIQYMVAMSILERVPGCQLSNVKLEGWNITFPQLPIPQENRFEHREAQHGNVESLSMLLNTGGIDCVEYMGYGQRVENFLPVSRYREVFRSEFTDKVGFGVDDLVISIRGAELLSGVHAGYVLLPLDYYEELIRETGLNPVFMGQLGNDIYSEALRRRFPRARFVASKGPVEDFETLRGSVNVVPSVSTFAWLACWLSRAENIFMPLSGLFNLGQYPTHDFAPVDDGRFRYTWFPANYGAPVADYELNHRSLYGRWRKVGLDELMKLKRPNLITRRSLDRHVACFDKDFYKARYPDVEVAMQRGWQSEVLHYIRSGFHEGREPFLIDKAWYARTYPDAAAAIGLGEYSDIYHHYCDVGRRKGYLRIKGQQPETVASA